MTECVFCKDKGPDDDEVLIFTGWKRINVEEHSYVWACAWCQRKALKRMYEVRHVEPGGKDRLTAIKALTNLSVWCEDSCDRCPAFRKDGCILKRIRDLVDEMEAAQ